MTRADTGVTAATGSARAHDEEPDGGVPEADHRPRQRDGEQHHQDEVDAPKPPAESANASSQISPAIEASTIAVNSTRRPVSGSAVRSDGVVGRAVGQVMGAFPGPQQDIAGGGFKVQSGIGTGVSSEQAQALWYVGARARPKSAPSTRRRRPPGRCACARVASALSRGTERLVFSGRVPESEYERMRAPFMDGAFPFPVKYGYAMVGARRGRAGRAERPPCFSLYPHQTVFNLPAENIVPLPDGLPPERAVLAANMETALNATWDGAAGPAAASRWSARACSACWWRGFARSCRARR